MLKGQRFCAERFTILGHLGSGSMGEVYRAYDRELDEIVAMKVVSAESPLDSSARLRREVTLSRRINSPYVGRIHDLVDLGQGMRGLTMAYVEGATLSQRINQGLAVDYQRFAQWGADVAMGLAAAHDQGIIHRDLKPENIMISREGRGIVLDFGIALEQAVWSGLAQTHLRRLTQNGVIMGTPLYMSPEQILSMPLDGRSDLFALGLILAEMITGEVPMGGTNYAELMAQRVTNVRPFQLRAIDPGTPMPIATIIDELLEVQVDRRPRTAFGVAQRLRHASLASPRLEWTQPPSPPLNFSATE